MAERPVLAVAYGPRSVPVLQLVEAAAGRCELVWMIDDRLPEMGDMARLLRRFGTVVAIGGHSIDATVDAVGPHRPDGIATYFDAGMVDIAHLAVRLGLPFYSPETATAMVDKLVQRQMMTAAGLAVPRLWDVPTTDDLESVLGKIDAADDLRAPESLGEPAQLEGRRRDGLHHATPVRAGTAASASP